MAPDKTNFLVQVISVGIITFAVAQDTLGVLGVCLGKSAPRESTLVTNGGMGSRGKRAGQMLNSHSSAHSSILSLTGIPHPPTHSELGLALWGKAYGMQLQSRDNGPWGDGGDDACGESMGGHTSEVLNKSLQEARSQ